MPPLDLSQQFHVFPVLEAPGLDAVLQMRPHEDREERDNLPSLPAGYSSVDAAQVTLGLLCCKHTLPDNFFRLPVPPSPFPLGYVKRQREPYDWQSGRTS